MASKKPPPDKPGRPQKDGGTVLEERVSTKKPRMWRVLMHNDDYTTQEFVVYVLTQFFRKEPTLASFLMLKVHQTGKAIVGVYTKDIAETKVAQVTDYAREQGHPLQLTTEPDE